MERAESVEDILNSLMLVSPAEIGTVSFAEKLDTRLDSLAPSRRRAFVIPHACGGDGSAVYLCGNSLGLQPIRAREFVLEELDRWGALGVEGHFRGDNPWVSIEDTIVPGLAAIVGALPSEVAAMGSLTANLHHLMATFYTPTPDRYRILIEAHAFPSDAYAVKSQAALHGRSAADAIVEVAPTPGSETIKGADLIAEILRTGPSLALVLLSGVQYYTGQAFDIPAIVAAAHSVGAVVGIDAAHAVGNLPLELHAWNVDFAVWCSYKYLNAGPGGLGGLFVHEQHTAEGAPQRPLLAGWWGNRRESRFDMSTDFEPCAGAARFQQSNPPVLQAATLRASLEEFAAAGGMKPLRMRSLVLTGYLEALLRGDPVLAAALTIITPATPSERGAQLSLLFHGGNVQQISERLSAAGAIVDIRSPNVIRAAPTPLYNTAVDVALFVEKLGAVVRDIASENAASAEVVAEDAGRCVCS